MDCELLTGLHTELPDSTYTEGRRRGQTLVPASTSNKDDVPILDAVATVLVSHANSEVIASGIQIDRKKNETILTIASNMPVKEATREHLENLWEQLKKLADAYLEIASKSSGPGIVYVPEEMKQQIRKFERSIYVYSLKRLSRQIHKSSGEDSSRFDEFSRLVDSIRGYGRSVSYHLDKISRRLKWVSERLLKDGSELQGQLSDQFLDYMDTMKEHINKLLTGKTYPFELVWLDRPSGFPAAQYLRKIASLPNFITTFIDFAKSPRLRKLYLARQSLHVNVLSIPGHTIDLPQSPEAWNNIAKRAARNGNWMLPTDLKDLPGHQIADRFKNKEGVLANVHCECAIALHFIRRSDSSPPPIGYIGVSKLSCLACWYFLQSLSNSGFHMVTKGCHAKAYFPWKYPAAEIASTRFPKAAQNSISSHFLSSLTSSYIERLKAEHSRRLFADTHGVKAHRRIKPRHVLEEGPVYLRAK